MLRTSDRAITDNADSEQSCTAVIHDINAMKADNWILKETKIKTYKTCMVITAWKLHDDLKNLKKAPRNDLINKIDNDVFSQMLILPTRPTPLPPAPTNTY